MSKYKHGDWYCKPANEAEAREIVERAVASGAVLRDSTNLNSDYGYDWNLFPAWGVHNGRTNTGQTSERFHFGRSKEYTLPQLRKMFPLPDEQGTEWDDKGWLPSVGDICEYFPINTWIKCKVLFVGERMSILSVQGVDLAIELKHVKFRPIRSERDVWIEQAERAIEAKTDNAANSAHAGLIYDALKSGELKAPTGE